MLLTLGATSLWPNVMITLKIKKVNESFFEKQSTLLHSLNSKENH